MEKTADSLNGLSKARGIAVAILDIFENVLDKHDIRIPDDDRTGDEGEACIYGCTYGDLEEQISEILCNYQLKRVGYE